MRGILRIVIAATAVGVFLVIVALVVGLMAPDDPAMFVIAMLLGALFVSVYRSLD